MPTIPGVHSHIWLWVLDSTFYTDYDSETDDDNDELENSPPAKRQKLDGREESSGSSVSSCSKNIGSKDESGLPFLLTSVRGIPSEFNARNLAIGIKGTCMYMQWIECIKFVSCDEQWRCCGCLCPLWTKENFKKEMWVVVIQGDTDILCYFLVSHGNMGLTVHFVNYNALVNFSSAHLPGQ